MFNPFTPELPMSLVLFVTSWRGQCSVSFFLPAAHSFKIGVGKANILLQHSAWLSLSILCNFGPIWPDGDRKMAELTSLKAFFGKISSSILKWLSAFSEILLLVFVVAPKLLFWLNLKIRLTISFLVNNFEASKHDKS